MRIWLTTAILIVVPLPKMLYFAYDGSVGGDWVAHYAVRLAVHSPDKILHLVHVRDGNTLSHALAECLEAFAGECDRVGVSLDVHLESPSPRVIDAIEAAVPRGRDSFLICGTRTWGARRGFLSDTLSQRFLSAGHRNVLAMRVVQPGLLGSPRSFLVPVSGHPLGMRAGLAFLRLFAPAIERLHILWVEQVKSARFRRLSHADVERLRTPGEAYCKRIEHELTDELGLEKAIMDERVVVADNVPKEIVLHASRTKSRLIYLGASERTLAQRILYGAPIEQVLRDATCDVAIYRGFA